MNRLISRIGAAVVTVTVFLCFAAVARAEWTNPCGENVVWTMDDAGVLTVSGTGPMADYIEEKPPWSKALVRSVVIEPGVTGIGALTFANCTGLKSVEIADTVVSVGDYAFSGCTRLERVSLPDSVREIGANPFSMCEALSEISLSPDHPVFSFRSGILFSEPDRRLIGCAAGSGLTDCVVPEDTLVIGDEAFSGCGRLHSVTVPEGVTALGQRAFCDCGALKSVSLPASLVSVGNAAFASCGGLSSVTLREGLRSIGFRAFYRCGSLENLILPASLEELGDRTFEFCDHLRKVTVSVDHPYLAFENGLLFSKTDGRLFWYAAEYPGSSCAVPEGVRSIGDNAFGNGQYLRTVSLPDSLREIGKQAFSGCRQLEEIVFSPGLERIGARAFENLTLLKDVVLPETVKSIGDEAFAGCDGLESVTIPAGVEELGKNVFVCTDTINLIVRVAGGSAAERYCRENGLKTVLPGQEPPKPEADLPPAFAEQYPGYTGLYQLRWEGQPETHAVFLAQTPEDVLVLLCGVERGGSWSIVESAPLPAESRIVLYDGLELLDLGFVRCAVWHYHDDVWGIDYIGWKDMFVGPAWIGSQGPQGRYFGRHPWGDLRTIDWISLDDSWSGMLKRLDVSDFATPRHKDRGALTPIYVSPDENSEKIADLVDSTPLFVSEKDSEWTHVSFGSDDEKRWKMDGWIRTEDLAFGPDYDGPRCTVTDELLMPKNRDAILTLVTPSGSESFPASEYDLEYWYAFGENEIGGQEYWLVYDGYSERLGFILKSDMHDLNDD